MTEETMEIVLGWPDEAVEEFRRAVLSDYQSENDDRTYIVTELCPHCGSEIEMRWNTDELGYRAFCPVCGKRLMLCDECRHTDGISNCDYDSDSDTCRFNRTEGTDRIVIQVESGMVTGIYGSSADTRVEVLDFDTADAEQSAENREAFRAVKADIEAGRLVELR